MTVRPAHGIFPARLCGLILAILLPAFSPGKAWGPHSEITRAAVLALGENNPLVRHLGPAASRLASYAWMADLRHDLIGDTNRFYAADYLLFPGMVKHPEHVCPEVQSAYEPYFRRAIQALRTENPENSARWIGSLVHFVEDTGSPPHAAHISGDMHTKMENWVDPAKITLPDYKPELLGVSEEEAKRGLISRMDGLIAYSKERALRCRPFIEHGERTAVEPIVLESALETARVVTDLLYTLGQVALRPYEEGAGLRGRVILDPVARMERLSSKVMLISLDRHYSTLTDESGSYQFQNLPPDTYRGWVLSPGHDILAETFTLGRGEKRVQDLTLRPDGLGGNLIRNGDFRLKWISKDRPDGWYRLSDYLTGEARPLKREKVGWVGEPLPVQPGQRFRLTIRWKPEAKRQAVLSWRLPKDAFVAEPALGPDEGFRVFSVPEPATFAQITFRSEESPETECDGISWVREP